MLTCFNYGENIPFTLLILSNTFIMKVSLRLQYKLLKVTTFCQNRCDSSSNIIWYEYFSAIGVFLGDNVWWRWTYVRFCKINIYWNTFKKNITRPCKGRKCPYQISNIRMVRTSSTMSTSIGQYRLAQMPFLSFIPLLYFFFTFSI